MQLESVCLNLHKDINAYGGSWIEMLLKLHVYQSERQDKVHAQHRAQHSLLEQYNLIALSKEN